MKNKLFAFVASVMLFTSFNMYSCTGFRDKVRGSGNVKIEMRNLTGFSEIQTRSSVDVKVRQGETFEVKVEADDNLIQYISTEVEGNVLVVDIKEDINIRDNNKMLVYVTMPVVKALSARGSGNIIGEGKFTGETIEVATMGSGNLSLSFDGKGIDAKTKGSGNIDLSGNIVVVQCEINSSGNIEASLECVSMDLSVHGSGNMNIKGKTDDFKARVHGSGNIDCYNLITQKADIAIQGSGNCNINVTEHLNASVEGSGNIDYDGNPAKVVSRIKGSGKISKR